MNRRSLFSLGNKGSGRRAASVALICALLLPQALQAGTAIISGPLINVNFNADKNPAGLGVVKTGVAAVGQTSDDIWNVCSRDGASAYDWLSFVVVNNLVAADGTATGAGLSLANAPGAWYAGTTDPMFNSYLYPFDGGNITLTITNLPAGGYDIYLYGHGNPGQGGANGVYQLSTGGIDYGTQSTATSGTAWTTTDWQEGQQYVVFRNVAISNLAQNIVVTGLHGATGEAVIAGMQIAPAGSVAAVAPTITNQPASQSVSAGANATFMVGATGSAPLYYQWLVNGNPMAQQTNSSLMLTNVGLGLSGNFYSVVVSNSVNSTNSTAARLTVNTPPPPGVVTLLNVNFYADKNPYDLGAVKTGFAAIGLTSNDYWNGCSRDGASAYDWVSFVVVNTLTNADGTVTGAGLSLANAPGAWDNGVADAMYNSYLYPFNGGNVTLTITNLPAGSYDLILYGHGNPGQGGDNGVYQVSSGGNDYGTQSTATSGTAWATTAWLEGQQYVVFRNVTVSDPSQPIVVTGLPGQGGEALIAGMQLAPTGSVPLAAPVIAGQPMDQSVLTGADVTFSVVAGGSAPLGYQWLVNGNPLAQQTNSSLTLANVGLGLSGNLYSVVVSNSVNSTNSTAALLTVSSPQQFAPVITSQPADRTVFAGANVTFAVGATGTAPLYYQWLVNGSPVALQTNSLMTLNNVGLGLSGNLYSVVVSNSVNSTNSAAARLTVNSPPPPPPPGTVTLLNVNFYADKNPYDLGAVKTGFAAIGLSSDDYWNGCSRDGDSAYNWLTFVVVNTLTNADGTVTGAGLSLANAPGAWDNGVADAMYNSYLYPFDGGNLTLTITNLPAGSYDLYLYGHGNVQGPYHDLNGVYQVSSGGNDYGTQSTATNGTDWATTAWLEGQQYVVFRNVAVSDPSQPIVVTGLPGRGGEALIAGMQLLPSGNAPAAAPTITIQPKSQTVLAGANVTFTVGASGTGPLSYQWLVNSGTINQATNSSLTLTNVDAGLTGNSYSVVVSNSVNSTSSAAVLLTVNTLTLGSLIDVNFNADKNPYGLGAVKTGVAAIGLSSNDFWNVCSRDGTSASNWLAFVTVSNLVTADGSVTAAGLSLANAPGAWANGTADPMYNAYLYPFDNQNLVVTVSNLPAGTYDFYLYGHGEQVSMNGVYQLSSGGIDYGTLSTATNGSGWASTDWQEGQQYVVFRGVTVSNSPQPVVVTGLPGATNRPPISGRPLIAGMQIAQQLNSGNVTSSAVFGLPVLKMSTGNGSLMLSWTASAKGFVLESRDGMGGSGWTPVGATPVIVESQFVVTLPLSATTGRLYHLRHQ